jgi:adenosylcobinamide-GDP ribazoletransferase
LVHDPLVRPRSAVDPDAAASSIRGRSPLLELAAAVAFLTRVPVPRRWLVDGRTGAAAFGLAGAASAAVAAIPLVVAGQAHPGPTAVAAVGILAILTGALHLDGLADTADALAAPAGAADRARTDPRAGTAGVVAIVLVLLLDAALVADLASVGGWLAGAALVTAGAASRSAATVAGVLAGPARAGGRLGAWFIARLGPTDAWLAIGSTGLVAVGAALLAGPAILAGLLGGSALALVIGAVVVRLRRRLDGDGFGAVIELTFTAVLAATLVARTIGG